MLVGDLKTTLTLQELQFARKELGREPNALEWSLIDAEWSEHCSYKSSKPLLTQLLTTGPRVLIGPGYDSGVVDIGDGYVLTFHIESHNHPSAVDPYGGAATGIGGVVRDILCMGNIPIALLDSLRFGEIASSDHSKWIMKNVIRGIADYGNCIGVPTVAGEIEFNECFERNCLVDVACLGVGRKEELLLAEATHRGDSIFLIGGSTGRDGIHGATFASRTLAVDVEQERSAVQIPDPFTKKLIIEATLEASRAGILRGCKDLGGGGLATGISEIADKGGTGIEVYLDEISIREAGMSPIEVMISESQERMLLVVKEGFEDALTSILQKYGVRGTRIGQVVHSRSIKIVRAGSELANLPTSFLANAPIIQRVTHAPALREEVERSPDPPSLEKAFLDVVASPSIASKRWVFQQYDHEVGIRTITKPGEGDAAVLKLPNGKLAAVKLDGNSRYCQLDPYVGAASVLAECCRNVVAVGAEPIAMLDHCQFGDPNDEEIFWAFSVALKGIADFAKAISLPCVGGKVSFYNQDEETGEAINPSPVIAVLGLIDRLQHVTKMGLRTEGDVIIAVGETKPELGGSEYHHTQGIAGSKPPTLDFELERKTHAAVLDCIRSVGVNSCHDCSSGGIGVALAEMALAGNKGASVELTRTSTERLRDHELLFSESNSRFILCTNKPAEITDKLTSMNLPSAIIGTVAGSSLEFRLQNSTLRVTLDELREFYSNSIERILEPWQK